MVKRESKFSILFRHWIMANPMHSAAFEMKQTKTDSIPFSCVELSQQDYGKAIMESGKGVLIRVQGGGGEPDYIYLHKVPSYVVIKFPDFFCLINMRLWHNEKAMSARKSLTAKRAREIADTVVDLKKP